VIGILLLYSSVGAASGFLSGVLITWLVGHSKSGPGVALAGLAATLGWVLGILPAVFLLPLLFPDGRLPSRRWRPFVWLIFVFLAIISLSFVFGQRILTGSNDAMGIANPLFLAAVHRLPKVDPLIGVLFPTIFAVSVASLFIRFRRTSDLERQQIKWVAFGLLAAFVVIMMTSFLKDHFLNSVISGAAFLAFPLSIGVSVLRFHLYDLDVVVKKTVVYAALALFATLIYVAIVVGLGATAGRGSSFLTMVAAVVVAVTFQPVRARLTRLANRLVYGKRATPYEILSEFSERVGDAYASEDVLPRMARILGEGVGAERADVWLVVDRELRDVAAWPSGAPGQPAIVLSGGDLPPIEGADRVYPVGEADELFGALSIRKPLSDPVSPADEKLIADLASQARLVLGNVRLTEELKVRLEDLKGAQKRLVTARDEERRRLERNIHDGSQQQLVALAVKLKLVDGMMERDSEKAHELLGQIQQEANAALEDLRDLARGIYPPLLADKGLAAALVAQARKSGLPVEFDVDGVGRYPQDVEAAAYFSCLEALQNVAKYASASRVSVSLAERDGRLVFSVTDDGRGFDPSERKYGTGLQGISDRLGALDGVLRIESAPGSGAMIEGRLPI
jgi:signal transduction histidine kinase